MRVGLTAVVAAVTACVPMRRHAVGTRCASGACEPSSPSPITTAITSTTTITSTSASSTLDPRALPARHLEPRPARDQASTALTALAMQAPASAALALTGARDGRAPLAFALDLHERLTGDHLDAVDGPALVEAARLRDRIVDASAIGAGDLLVFDRAVDGAPASLVAVALAVDDRGVVTMMFLAAGVIRVGAVCPAHPSQRRDPAGRILNTFLRHRDDPIPPGTRFLAGELLGAVIRAR